MFANPDLLVMPLLFGLFFLAFGAALWFQLSGGRSFREDEVVKFVLWADFASEAEAEAHTWAEGLRTADARIDIDEGEPGEWGATVTLRVRLTDDVHERAEALLLHDGADASETEESRGYLYQHDDTRSELFGEVFAVALGTMITFVFAWWIWSGSTEMVRFENGAAGAMPAFWFLAWFASFVALGTWRYRWLKERLPAPRVL